MPSARNLPQFAIDPVNEYEWTWDVPNILYGSHLMWPMIPGMTFGQIRSLKSFTVVSKRNWNAPQEEQALDPEWLGLGFEKGGPFGTGSATIAHWCDDGTAVFPVKLYSREAVQYLIRNIPQILEYSSITPECCEVFARLVEPQLVNMATTRDARDNVFVEVTKGRDGGVFKNMAWWSN